MQLLAVFALIFAMIVAGASVRYALAAHELGAMMGPALSLVGNALTVFGVLPYPWRLALAAVVLWLVSTARGRVSTWPEELDEAAGAARVVLRQSLLTVAVAEVLAVVIPVIVLMVIVQLAFGSSGLLPAANSGAHGAVGSPRQPLGGRPAVRSQIGCGSGLTPSGCGWNGGCSTSLQVAFMTLCTQQLTLGLAADTTSFGFQLQVVIERFEEPIVGMTLNVERDLLIGRCPSAGLIIDGRLVSRQHVLVRSAQSGLEIEDVSSNGTLVDGNLLLRARKRVGSQCKLLVGCVRLTLQRVMPPPPAIVSVAPPRSHESSEQPAGHTLILGSEIEARAKRRRALFSAAGGVRSDSMAVDLLTYSVDDYAKL